MLRISAALAGVALFGGAVVAGHVVGDMVTTAGPAPVQRYIPVKVAASAYMDTHPARPVPGMTAGVVVQQLLDVPLPGSCPPGHRWGSVGGPDMCVAWAYVVQTAAGGRVRFRCGAPISGSRPRGVPCTDGPGPLTGDYVYIPAGGGQITRARAVRTIRSWAIDVEDQGVPAGGA
jgi:hypothetical protein